MIVRGTPQRRKSSVALAGRLHYRNQCCREADRPAGRELGMFLSCIVARRPTADCPPGRLVVVAAHPIEGDQRVRTIFS